MFHETYKVTISLIVTHLYRPFRNTFPLMALQLIEGYIHYMWNVMIVKYTTYPKP